MKRDLYKTPLFAPFRPLAHILPRRKAFSASFFFLIFFIFSNSGLAAGPLEPSRIPSLLSGIRNQGPLAFCGEPVPLESQEIKERLEKELLLALWNRAQVILWIKRTARYFPIIEKGLRAHGLPDDLKYITVVESALLPHAGSSKGAIGFWQFMRATGRKYGLTVNHRIDERRNIFSSTEAAIRYLKDLYALTQSWSLAAAAYNMGEQGLIKEIKAQEVNDYYRLYLPLETQRYVFKILSAKLILSSPEKYGFTITPEELYPQLEFDRIQLRTKSESNIQTLALAAGTYFKHIKDLNPQIRGYALPRGRHTIYLPRGSGDGFEKRFRSIIEAVRPDKTQKIYIIKKGDSLSEIADRFRIPLTSLVRWNHLNINDPIHPGDRLFIYKK